jgi:hypothetical protein
VADCEPEIELLGYAADVDPLSRNVNRGDIGVGVRVV